MHDRTPILVAEDDEDDFFFLRRAAREASLDNPLLRFRDGEELVRFLERIPSKEASVAGHTPWVAFIDLTMPMMNGFEVLDWLRLHQRLPRIRPIVVSGSYRPADVERAIALGAVDYLVKPITPMLLGSIMSRQLPQAA
jgi:CheY-like chemotaxis protein